MNKDELLKLYDAPLDELLSLAKKNLKNEVEFCAIINAKSGKCGENCKYCAQSCHHKTNVSEYPLISKEEVIEKAKEAKNIKAKRIGIVTSGKKPTEKEFLNILDMIEGIEPVGISPCASLGILTKDELIRLKNKGLKRFHHNINSSKNYYPKVCTTHSWQDRFNTCKLVKEVGLELCSGVIIGMGESREDRVDMALELSELSPESIPINVLFPIKGTPFENYWDKITEDEILRTFAIFKIANPNSNIRFAGGKIRISDKNQELLYNNCTESSIIGDLLTTTGKKIEEDIAMIERLNKEISLV